MATLFTCLTFLVICDHSHDNALNRIITQEKYTSCIVLAYTFYESCGNSRVISEG